MITIFIIWFVGVILSYILCRKWLKLEAIYTVSDRVKNIVVSLILSWLGVIVFGIVVLVENVDNKPAKW